MLVLQGQEAKHILVSELIAAVVMAWMAVEAVYHENAFELLASAAVACAVSARVLYFMVCLLMSTKCSCFKVGIEMEMHDHVLIPYGDQSTPMQFRTMISYQSCLTNAVANTDSVLHNNFKIEIASDP